MKKHLYLFLPATCFLLILSSCKKGYRPEQPPPVDATFSLRDSLIIESQYVTAVPEIYNRYNGKTYMVNSENLELTCHEKVNDDVVFYCKDLSSGILTSSFSITIKDTDFTSLLPEYNLADSAHIEVYCTQMFDNNTEYRMIEKAKSGVLKISYNEKYRTVSGEITNLKTPIDFYVPDDPQPNRIAPSILIRQGGSTRSVSLKFDFVRTTNW
jgi:hypothetical protein